MGGKDKNQAKQERKQKPKKPVHWSKQLPKSSMSLDATKKLFFNKQPYNEKFFDTFWDTFDAEGYSFFLQKYNYNSENTIYFQAQNLLGGYLQRAESCRKFASGIWLFRGKEYLPEMKNHVSSEYYTWTKLDVTKDEDKALIKTMYMADKVPDGIVLDRRYFK